MKNWDTNSPGKTSDFGKEGRPLTYALAGRLCDEMENWKVNVNKILYSEHTVARQTAKIYAEVLDKRNGLEGEICCCKALTPETFRRTPEACNNTIATLVNQENQASARTTPRSAVIVVGHQPQLTQVAARLIEDDRRRLTPSPRLTQFSSTTR